MPIEMEPAAMVVDKLKAFAQSTQDFASRILHRSENSKRRSPIEILKRLQREAFSDIMKLRDRQEKVERLLSFYKTSKASPFQEASTRVKGEFDVVGALLMMDTVDQSTCDALQRAGIKTGIDYRLWFETTIREKDTLLTEFVGSERGGGDILGSPLSLAKVLYCANVSNWFSAVAIPVGARCRDVSVGTSSPHQEKALTDYSTLGPPFLNDLNGSAIGIMTRKSNIVASLAQFASGIGAPPISSRTLSCFSTFGQVVCQLSTSTKLTLMGIHKVLKVSSQQPSLGSMTFPIGIFRRHQQSRTSVEEEDLLIGTIRKDSVLDGSMALMLESQLDESTRIGGWIEMKKSHPKTLQWAITMSDIPEDDFGWGLSLGGLVQGPTNCEHFQIEAFLNFNLGNRCRMQPAILYVVDGETKFPTLMFRSSFSL
nr:uncharacterized protein LOC109187207 isoform X1 [Ipomoea trifida]